MQGSVASYVGAWIETRRRRSWVSPPSVASYVGAWIETVSDATCMSAALSHPMWVRGLKLALTI